MQWPEEVEPEIDVREYARLVWGKKWLVLGVLLATVVFATAWALTRPKMYRATTKIALQPPPQLSANQFDLAMSWWQMDRFIADQVEVLKTRALAQRVVNRLGLESHPAFIGGDAAGALLGSLEAKPIPETFVVEVTLKGRDPATVSEWLNIYIEEYKAANIENSLERTREVYEVIQKRLDPLREKVAGSELDLMRFREREDAVLFADQDKNVITEQVSTLTTAYAEAKSERIRLETKLNALRSLRASNISENSFSEVLKDPTIQALVQQRNGLQVELTDALRTLKEGHPDIKELRSRIGSLDERIAEQVNNIRVSLQTDFDIVSRRERSLYANIQQLKEETISLSKQTLELDRLEREYNQNKAFLEDMLARSNEADISSTNSLLDELGQQRAGDRTCAAADRPLQPECAQNLGPFQLPRTVLWHRFGARPRLPRPHPADARPGGTLRGSRGARSFAEDDRKQRAGFARGLPVVANRDHAGRARRGLPGRDGDLGGAGGREDHGGFQPGQGPGHGRQQSAVGRFRPSQAASAPADQGQKRSRSDLRGSW
jgi:uncharacterized protein involved in exopolysaccharide biosynthesis